MKIVILTGGTGPESDIAIRSAQTICDNISQDYDYYILPAEMDKFLSNYSKYDLAIPMFHGEYGEDGQIFGLLKSLNLKHTFSGYKTHTVCMDKNITNQIAEKIGLQVPRSVLIENISQIKDINLNYPLIVKPNSGGSSIATYKINSPDEITEAVSKALEISKDIVLVQEFITGKEYSVPLIGNNNPEILPIMRVELKTGEFFDYEEKYNSDGSNEVFSEIDEELKNRLEKDSRKIYEFLECRGFSRIEFIANKNGIYFLEINTIPGFSAVSIFPKARKITGRTLTQIVDKFIELGLE